MATHKIKEIGEHGPEVQASHGNVWEIMKPFVHFGIKATRLIAGVLFTIVKNIPKPDNLSASERKKDKVIKT
jgi:hypothetical protein